MTPGKLVLKGIEIVLKNISPYLKTDEEKNLFDAQTDKVKADSISTLSKSFSDSIKTLAEARALDMGTLNQSLKLYKDVGYTEDEIKERIGPQMDKLLETYEDLNNLKNLVVHGQILKVTVRENNELEDKS
jgi:hypothetical protein